ncbi:MAG TPA: AI-2E family transporter [Lacunisphaera sp.]|nr:AI-2E family transporter [Lacunisphaera sp.]
MQATRALPRPWPPYTRVVGYVAVALAFASLFLLAWNLREIFILAFGSIVLAAVIRAIALPLVARYPQREKLLVGLVILGLFLVLGGLFWLFGHQIALQAQDLRERLPEAVDKAKAWLEQNEAGRAALEKMQNANAAPAAGGDAGETANNIGKVAFITLDKLGHALLVVVSGIYLALTPRLYLGGTVRLFPVAQRGKVRDALQAAGETLRRWLLGQLVSMTTIGVLTTLGLWIAGCPVPLALGILAGLVVFVPVIGFLVAFIPMLLMALSKGPQVAIASVVVFLIVQQIEEQIVHPLAQRWATSLPPALGLLALAASGALFGLPGFIFGCPLTVVAMVLVQKLYIEHGLEGKKGE